MAYIVFNTGGGVQKHLVTNTCNKPRIAVKDGNTTSYIPMKTTTVTVSTSVQITSTTGTTYNTLQKTTSANGGGQVTCGTCGYFDITTLDTTSAIVEHSGDYTTYSTSWGYGAYYTASAYSDINGKAFCYAPRTYEAQQSRTSSIEYEFVSSITARNYGPYGGGTRTFYTYKWLHSVYYAFHLREWSSDYPLFTVSVGAGNSNNIYYTVTTGASFGTRTTTISKELTVVTYV